MGGTPVTRLLGSFSLAALLLLSSCGMGGGGGGGGSSLPSTTFTPPGTVSMPSITGNDIAVDRSNNVWVVVTPGVLKIPYGTTSCPSLTACPIISVGFTPAGIASDKSGNIWVTNDTSPGSVTEIKSGATSCSSTNCTTFSNSGYFSSPVGIAADSSGNIWVTDDSTNSPSVTEIKLPATSCTSSCTTFSGSSYFTSPVGIAADSSGNIWVTNDTSSGSVTEIKSGASPSCSSTACPTYGGFSNPVAVAAPSASGSFAWVANSSGGSVVEMDPNQCETQNGCHVIKGFQKPVSLAFDPSGNLWVIDAGTSQIIEISEGAISSASCQSGACYFYSLPSVPMGVASDSFGNIWVTLNNGQIIKFSP